jgi:xanthosine utilization system XapX-like protein
MLKRIKNFLVGVLFAMILICIIPFLLASVVLLVGLYFVLTIISMIITIGKYISDEIARYKLRKLGYVIGNKKE